MTTKAGRFELADKGTMLLDEVGELSLKSQVDFLRVLETKEFLRLGGTKLIKVDTRIIATNRNLKKAVKQGDFREDLYYRLNVVPIQLRRSAGGMISALSRTIPQRFRDAIPTRTEEVSHDAMRLLRLYSWPGNIRQLRNLMERRLR
jgi:two-component system response regulator AtoC